MMTAKAHSNPWYRAAKVAEPCTCCGRELRGRAVRMLELDQRTNTFHDLGGVPADKSQGAFPFGLRCAKKEIARHIKAIGGEV